MALITYTGTTNCLDRKVRVGDMRCFNGGAEVWNGDRWVKVTGGSTDPKPTGKNKCPNCGSPYTGDSVCSYCGVHR